MISLPQVQAAAAAKLSAVPALAAFGAPILFDLHAEPEAAANAIAARIRATGVCLEIGDAVAPSPASAVGGGLNQLSVEFQLFAAEKTGGTHSPNGKALVNLIVAAICADQLPNEQGFSCTGYDAAVSESGYVMHVIGFSIQVASYLP